MSELRLFDNEYNCIIAGVDEAGRGPLAGPVVAAAVIIEDYFEELEEINDSKKLTEKKREKLYAVIREKCKVGIGTTFKIYFTKLVHRIGPNTSLLQRLPPGGCLWPTDFSVPVALQMLDQRDVTRQNRKCMVRNIQRVVRHKTQFVVRPHWPAVGAHGQLLKGSGYPNKSWAR